MYINSIALMINVLIDKSQCQDTKVSLKFGLRPLIMPNQAWLRFHYAVLLHYINSVLQFSETVATGI